MNVIIIEDEVQTAWDIRHCIKKLRPDYEILSTLDSVESVLEWLSAHKQPDLIISDIRLGDGLSFEIFKKNPLQCPVIFCTAYDEYAIEAFKSNGVDYLLKPVNEDVLEKSLKRIESLARNFSRSLDISLLDTLRIALEGKERRYRKSLLVSYRNQMIPISVDEIAFFSLEEDSTMLYTLHGKKYRLADSLDHLETLFDPAQFYRANRQHLVAHRVIEKIEQSDARKLLIQLTLPEMEPITVSKAKASEFLLWMENR